MKTTKFLALIAAAVMVMSLASCTYVEPGQVALKVYALGDNKGKIEMVGVGRHSVNMFGYYDYYRYPTNLQKYRWTAGKDGDNERNEAISFQVEGQDLSADIQISFAFYPHETDKMIKMFEYFRLEPEQIAEVHLRPDVINFFGKIVANMKVEEVYSTFKDSIITEVCHRMQQKYSALGIDIKEVAYLSSVRLPDAVKGAIDAKVVAKQMTEQRENEVAQTEAEARKKVAEADGEAQRLIREAEGRAKAMDVEGQALARNPQVIRLKEIEMQTKFAESAKSWNTVVMSSGQAGQMFNFDGKK